MATPPEIQAGYRCPLCPDHQDEDFFWLELAGTYVCDACRYEIDCGLDFATQPTIAEYNCADTIERLLTLLGVNYEELKRRHLESPETTCDIFCHTLFVE
ncbi:hypothetical protein [Citrifermentans bremense]|uniref:hypothetical protein n=1 Tax=Citrifermentans bremense TaxID=60035 RepID=UPI00047D1859|nr:hypothetical protein [Citrifermentans bremense]